MGRFLGADRRFGRVSSAQALVVSELAPESASLAIGRPDRLVAHRLLPRLARLFREIRRKTLLARGSGGAECQHQADAGRQLGRVCSAIAKRSASGATAALRAAVPSEMSRRVMNDHMSNDIEQIRNARPARAKSTAPEPKWSTWASRTPLPMVPADVILRLIEIEGRGV
jgi:hypothetical protein